MLSKLYIINGLLLTDLTLIKPNEGEELFLEKLILQLLLVFNLKLIWLAY